MSRADAKLDAIIARHELRRTFPEAALREARAWTEAPGLDDPALEDLSDLAFVTIDNEDSRDLDQALYLQERDDGEGTVLWYALADASYYVRPGTALFSEALARGASYYLPGFCLPMLPRLLSEGLVSLNPEVDRRALVFRMTLAADGRCEDTQVLRARIHSRAKLSYPGVQAFYDDPASSPISGQPWARSLELLRHVGQLRMAEQESRNVVRYRRTDARVEVEGEVFVAIGEARNDTEKYNEQISLLCNTEGARLMAEIPEAPGSARTQPVFRVHPSPPRSRLEGLAETLEALVRVRDLDPKIWRWDRRKESLAAFVRRLPLEGPQGRLGRAVQQQALVINHRSTFSEEPGLHFGVGAEVYGRFTSPMREVVGIWTHKELLEQLGLEPPAPESVDEIVREKVITRANSSRETQRKITKAANMLAIDALLEADLALDAEQRPARQATVMGLTRTRMYAQLDAPPLELKVYFVDLEREIGHQVEPCFGELGIEAGGRRGRLVLGDPVRLKVVDYDRRRSRYVLIPEAWIA